MSKLQGSYARPTSEGYIPDERITLLPEAIWAIKMTQLACGLSGYIPVRDNFALDYCAQLGVKSLLPICDEVIIGDAGSTDNTLDFFRDWSLTEPKIRIIHCVLPPLPRPDQVEADDPNRPPGDPVMLIGWLNQIRAHCRFEWQITLDADEVLNPKSYSWIKMAIQDGFPCWIKRANFWRSPQWEAPHGTVCGENVVRLAPTRMEMHSDEPCPGGEPEIRSKAVNGDNMEIWHFGFLRRQEAFLKKSRVVQAMIHNTYDNRLRQAERTGESWVDLSPFPENKPLLPRTDKFPDYVNTWLIERRHQLNK